MEKLRFVIIFQLHTVKNVIENKTQGHMRKRNPKWAYKKGYKSYMDNVNKKH